jgi:hypothetical protein
VPLPLRPELFVDFHMGAIGGCSGRKPRSVDDEKKFPLLSVAVMYLLFSGPGGFRRRRPDFVFPAEVYSHLLC